MKHWSRQEKYIFALSLMLSILLAGVENISAMHIMEGYLPLFHCIAWGAICLPFLTFGFIQIRRRVQNQRRSLMLFAMSGAFIFVISSLKIPSVTGSCSHMTGTGLGAILFGVSSTSILGFIVLLFQSILLAHGGLTTLGANTFSMAIAGPIFALLLYKLCLKLKCNRKVSIFLAAALGDLFTYSITSVQLALAYPGDGGNFLSSAEKFLAVFAPTQIPLAVMEGILTLLVIIGMESFASMELKEIGYQMEEK